MRDEQHQPFLELNGASRAGLPVVLSSPHSGTHFPLETSVRLAVGSAEMATLDDGPTDLLVTSCVELGATALCARYSRAYVDLNRNPLELDAAHFEADGSPVETRVTPKVEAGLGVVPSRIGGRLIHQGPMGLSLIAARLRAAYYPFHERLNALMARHALANGNALLLDCHSMPVEAARLDGRQGALDVAVGDRFGTSAHPALVDCVVSTFLEAGFKVARNRPYAGGFITEHYGRPPAGWHAIQLEIRRNLFFDRATRSLNGEAETLRAVLREVVERSGVALAALAGERTLLEARAPSPGDLPRLAALAAD